MRHEALIDILRTNRGKFFSCRYTKLDGSTRVVNGRLGVTRHLTRGSLADESNPLIARAKRSKGIVTVWDAQRRGYRSMYVRGISDLRMRGGVVKL